MAFAIGAKLQGQFNAAFKGAQTSVATLQNKIESLNRQQGDISAYQKQQKALEQTRSKLEYLNKEYELLKGQMGENGEASASLQTAMMRKQLQIEKTTASLEGQEQKLSSLGGKMSEAGIDTENLAKESQALASELDHLKGQQEEVASASENMGKSMGEAASGIEQMLAAAGVVAALKAGYGAIQDSAQAAIEFETGMAGVQRTVGGSQAFLDGLAESFKEMSAVIPITTESLAQIATTAGQLGVAQQDVESFTTVMAQLDTTTDLTADSAATMLAQFSNITGVTEYDRLGSVVADLGDATATTASKVVEMSQGLAAAASMAGMSATDIMGISAAVGSLGIEAQAGSTSMSTLINTIYTAVETGEGLTDFASVADMTAEQFKKAWGDDAVGALNAFIQGLNDTERNGRSAIVILDEMGIKNVRQTKAILGLAKAGDLLSKTVSQAGTAWQQNSALTEKASVMYETTGSKLTMMQNAVNNLRIAFGDALTPAISAGATALTGMIQPVAAFVQKHPALVKALVSAGAVIGAVTLAITGYAAAAKLAAAASALFTATIPGLNVIMFATAAIAGLTGGIVLLTEAFAACQESMEQLDAEFDGLNADFRKQSQIQGLCSEYKQLAEDLYGVSGAAYELEQASETPITLEVTAKVAENFSKLTSQDFYDGNYYIELTAEKANTLTQLDFIPEGTLVTLSAKAGETLLNSAALVNGTTIYLTAEATEEAKKALPPDVFMEDGAVQLTPEVKDYLSANAFLMEDSAVQLTPAVAQHLDAQGFLKGSEVELTGKALQTLAASGFLTGTNVTLTASAFKTLLGKDFMFNDDTSVSLSGKASKTLLAKNFLIGDNTDVTLSGKATQTLTSTQFLVNGKDTVMLGADVQDQKKVKAESFLDGDAVIYIQGMPEGGITVDDYIAATDRVVSLTANIGNAQELQASIASLQTEADSLLAQANEAQDSLAQADKDLAEMETRQANLESRLKHANKESDKSALQQEIEAQTEAIEAQRVKVGELELAYSTSATQYAITQQAADELARKESELTAVKAQLADMTDGVVSATEKETDALAAQVTEAERLAEAEKMRLRSQIMDNLTKQSKQYVQAVKDENRVMQDSSSTFELWNRLSKYTSMSAEELTATYNNMLKAMDDGVAKGMIDPFKGSGAATIRELEAISWLMGDLYSNMGSWTLSSFFEGFGSEGADAQTVIDQWANITAEVNEYNEQLKGANETQNTFMQNLSDGVVSGVMTAEEAYNLLSMALISAGADTDTVSAAVTELQAILAGLQQDTEGVASTTEESAAQVNAAIQPILDRMNELGEAYSAAYDEAYKSMDGQFKLFEEAPQLTEESVAKMIAALESQAAYMQQYSANLKAAGEMGLSEGLIAQLSDGSKESAAYLAAIVSDGSTKIDELNAAFASVEEGKAEFAGTVAGMQTDFEASMQALSAELAVTVSNMDMSAEAAAAGAATVQAFADAALGKSGAVSSAFQAVAKAAAGALNFKVEGHASGTENADPGLAWVGEHGPELMWFNGGEKVMNAQDSRRFARNSALSAEPAASSSGSSGGTHIEVKPVFNLSGGMDTAEVRSVLDDYTGRIREMVDDALGEIESDRERMAYSR